MEVRTERHQLFKAVSLAVGVTMISLTVSGQNQAAGPVITSFDNSGTLTWSDSETNAAYRIEWSPSLTEPWQESFSSLAYISGSNGQHSVKVPVFFRVVRVGQLVEQLAIAETTRPTSGTIAAGPAGTSVNLHQNPQRIDTTSDNSLTAGNTVVKGAQVAGEKRYSDEEIIRESVDFFFDRLARWDKRYHYYAAMWALARKCHLQEELRDETLSRARKLLGQERQTNLRIQYIGIMAEAEATRSSPECYRTVVNVLQTDADAMIRGFAAYSMLWFRKQGALNELRKALPGETSKNVRDSIEATISRITR